MRFLDMDTGAGRLPKPWAVRSDDALPGLA